MKNTLSINTSKILDLKKSAQETIQNYTDKIEFLESIEIDYKKDGSEYVFLNKAFRLKEGSPYKNFKVTREGEGHWAYELSAVDTRTNKYINARLYGYQNLEMNYSTREYDIPEGISKDRVIKESCFVPYYALNTKELQETLVSDICSLYEWREAKVIEMNNIDAMVKILKDTVDKLNALEDIPYGWKDIIW